MAMTTATNDVAALLPDQIGDLIVQPVEAESTAMQVSTVVRTGSHKYRIPLVLEDPSAAWVAEGAEITADDANVDELDVIPAKVAGLTIVTRELAEDSSPAAAEVVGQGLARDIARKIDGAFFSSLASPAPDGLPDLAGVSDVDAGGAWANADPFVEAIFAAEAVGAVLTSFVANPADALALMSLKAATGSNQPLLGVDPSVPTRRSIQGVALWTSPFVAEGTVWGVPQARVQIVLRDDVRLEVDRSVYFTSDRVAVKATMRVGFGFVHPAAVVKVALTP